MFVRGQVCGSKRVHCNAGCQEVSRCCTRGESDTGKEACKQVIQPDFETHHQKEKDCHQKSEIGVSFANDLQFFKAVGAAKSKHDHTFTVTYNKDQVNFIRCWCQIYLQCHRQKVIAD